MNKIFKVFLSICGVLLLLTSLGGGFYLFKAKKKELVKAFPVKEMKPFVIVIPSYNNTAFCEKNLRSVLDQNYPNFRVIYIDDCSTDDTYEKVKQIVDNSSLSSRIQLIRNGKNQGALANFYHAIHSCKDQEIVLCVDGDDFLAHPNVLNKLNETYADPDVWMTYGNYVDYPTYKQKPLICKKFPNSVLKNNSFRKHEWVASHLRTFYAGLFKQIALQDLLYKGHFYPMSSDLAFMIPMLEMSGKHARFISEVLYLYNRSNPLNDHKINLSLQQDCEAHIRSSRCYLPLKYAPLEEPQYAQTADLIIFSYNRPLQLYALLESIEEHISSVGKIFIIYRYSSPEYEAAYADVKKRFFTAEWVAQAPPYDDFQLLVGHTLVRAPSPYILFAVDDIMIKDKTDLRECINELEERKAYGFYLGYGVHLTSSYTMSCPQPLPPFIPLQNAIYAWQFKNGVADWNYPNSLDMVLYRKERVKQDLDVLTFANPNTLESEWAKKAKTKQVGLFYKNSKVLNVPLNLVNTVYLNRHMTTHSVDDLLLRFKQNQKIDYSSLFQIQNPSRHIEWIPTFIPREESYLSDADHMPLEANTQSLE